MQNGSNDSVLEVGTGGSGNRNAYIDLVGDTTYTDYGLRVIRLNTGANANSEIIHRGTGDFVLEANEAADIKFKTTDLVRLVIDSGRVCIGTDTSPDDRLHIKQATNDAVYTRIENSEGYVRIGTDANNLSVLADNQSFKSRSASSEYLNISSSLFDIKTAAKVNGALQVTGTITGNVTGTASQADNINIDETTANTNYQVTFFFFFFYSG